MRWIITNITTTSLRNFLGITNTAITDTLWKSGWTGQKEAGLRRRTMIFQHGLTRSRNMKEKQPVLRMTAFCLARKPIRQFVGLEMNLGLQMKKHGQNPVRIKTAIR